MFHMVSEGPLHGAQCLENNVLRSELRGYTIIIIIVIVDNGVFSFASFESFKWLNQLGEC